MSIDEAIKELENTKNVNFKDLLKICEEFFGAYRVEGSHHIFKTGWFGDPRVNVQKIKKGAKPYQVKQVVKALNKLKEMKK